MPMVGTSPDSRANTTKVGVEPRASTIMSWVRAPPPSSHRITGSRWRSACSNMRVVFMWLTALCVPPYTV